MLRSGRDLRCSVDSVEYEKERESALSHYATLSLATLQSALALAPPGRRERCERERDREHPEIPGGTIYAKLFRTEA